MSLAVVLIPLVGVFAGCALAPQTVGLHPKVELPARPGFGKGNRVALEAVDARPEKLIGYRGGVMKTGPITAANAADALAAAVGEGLAKQGFEAVSGASDRSLRIELTKLEYEVTRLPRSDAVAAKAEMKLVARCGDEVYEQYYKKVVLVPVKAAPPASFNEEFINHALSALVGDLLRDEKLLAFLAA